MAIDDGVGGEIIHAGEPHGLHFAEPVPHAAPRIGGVHAADHGNLLYDGQHFVLADLHRDGVGVAVGHEAGGRAVTGHPEAAGVVNDQEVGAAFLDELGGDAGASPRRDDRFAARDGGA